MLPIISIDNDGVVSTSGVALPGVQEVFQLLRQDLNQLDPIRFQHYPKGYKLPLQFVTNSGGCIESVKADKFNEMLNLQDGKQIKPQELVLNFTPLREQMLQFSNDIVLISGTEDYVSIAIDCGLKKYITFNEYGRMFPQLVPTIQFTQQEINEVRTNVINRLGLVNYIDFQEPLQVKAVFFLYDCINLEMVFQITIDVLTTTNGLMAQSLPDVAPPSHIPVYSVVNDFLFPAQFRMHRMGFGIFLDSLKDIHRKILKTNLEIVECGKPSKMTFEYAQLNGERLCSPYKPSKFYMIGDNPTTDIRGAKQQGWFTILVRTGLYKNGDILRVEDTPDAIVNNFEEAIRLIFQLESILN